MFKNERSVNGGYGFALHDSPYFPYPTLVLRLNTKLESNGLEPMMSLVEDLSDGVRLIQLMVRLAKGSLACAL
jgi:hypothetical protein